MSKKGVRRESKKRSKKKKPRKEREGEINQCKRKESKKKKRIRRKDNKEGKTVSDKPLPLAYLTTVLGCSQRQEKQSSQALSILSVFLMIQRSNMVSQENALV